MKIEKCCPGKKIGVFLLMLSLVLLPIHSSLLLAAEAPSSGPSTERDNGSHSGDAGPSTDRDDGTRGGDAGPGATKDVGINKWWWIGGGVVAVAAIAAAAGGGGGGGGGSTPSH
jgi:hypothetical protein